MQRTIGFQLQIGIAHDLAMGQYNLHRKIRGSQYAHAMSMLVGTYDWMYAPWSGRTPAEKRATLLSKLTGIVFHDRSINYHYVEGYESFPKI